MAGGACYVPGMRFRALLLLAGSFASAIVAPSCGGSDEASVADEAGTGTGDGGTLTEGGNGNPPPVNDAAKTDAPVTGAACTGKTGAVVSKTITMMSGGVMRTYELHVPPTYDPTKRTPLVFMFHGYTETSTGIANTTHFAVTADKRGLIVAFPQGIGNGFNAGDCCGTASSSNVDDVGFTKDMIAAIDAEYCIDAKRVYSAGFSNGGFLSYRLACELADKIAAVAPVAGGLRQTPATCIPTRPVPLLHVHGTGDIVVPYNGGGLGAARPVTESVDAFKTKNACAAGAGKVVYEKADVKCTAWGGCTAGADVELCTVTNGGHQWPGGEQLPYGGSPSPNLITSEAIADFFEAHPMP